MATKTTSAPNPGASCCESCAPTPPGPTQATSAKPGNRSHSHSHDHAAEAYWPSIASFLMLTVGLAADHAFHWDFFEGWIRLGWYLLAYLPVAWPVLRQTWATLSEGEVFTEFLLMSMATVGAFYIGEYPEGVAVMLFYTVGELFQGAAVRRARGNISALLDVRVDTAEVRRGGGFRTVQAEEVAVGETVRVKAGEKVPLDGRLLSEKARLDTSALTGESRPATARQGERVLAGMLNLETVVEVEVEKPYSDSSLARILDLVQNASAKKSKTELMIRRLARIYTPAVFVLALAVVFLPALWVEGYVFNEWLYRGLVFLVISCPCALVISIPLGYFGGIGAASRNGILFKGANYLDLMAKLGSVVMDKTGTLTKGVFEVQKMEPGNGFTREEFLRLLGALEATSTHPVAKAVRTEAGDVSAEATDVEELAGMGLRGKVDGKTVAAGNLKLLQKLGVDYPSELEGVVSTVVAVSVDGRYAGHVEVADTLKEDAKQAVERMHALGIDNLVMLSGDKDEIVQDVARTLGIDRAYGGLLPEDKVDKFAEVKRATDKPVAFVGDGINDAPVLALSDVGIAMGGMGSDVAIETADVVIQTDQPSRIATAVQIGQATRRIVFQNITLAFAVKATVLALGAGGIATLWEAVFADVGVALLAILNAVRVQRMDFTQSRHKEM